MFGTTSICEISKGPASQLPSFKVSRVWCATDGHQERETAGGMKGRVSSRHVWMSKYSAQGNSSSSTTILGISRTTIRDDSFSPRTLSLSAPPPRYPGRSSPKNSSVIRRSKIPAMFMTLSDVQDVWRSTAPTTGIGSRTSLSLNGLGKGGSVCFAFSFYILTHLL
jgi:hypothetical protein